MLVADPVVTIAVVSKGWRIRSRGGRWGVDRRCVSLCEWYGGRLCARQGYEYRVFGSGHGEWRNRCSVGGGDDGEYVGRSTETVLKCGYTRVIWEMMMMVIGLWSAKMMVLHLAFWLACSLMDVNQHLVARGFTGFACGGTRMSIPQLSA